MIWADFDADLAAIWIDDALGMDEVAILIDIEDFSCDFYGFRTNR